MILFEAVQKITLGHTEDIARLIRFRDNYPSEVIDIKLYEAIVDGSVLVREQEKGSEVITLMRNMI